MKPHEGRKTFEWRMGPAMLQMRSVLEQHLLDVALLTWANCNAKLSWEIAALSCDWYNVTAMISRFDIDEGGTVL